MQKVEHGAQLTIAQMKEKLEQKKAGKCECAAHDILCTEHAAGTLLGPGAVERDASGTGHASTIARAGRMIARSGLGGARRRARDCSSSARPGRARSVRT